MTLETYPRARPPVRHKQEQVDDVSVKQYRNTRYRDNDCGRDLVENGQGERYLDDPTPGRLEASNTKVRSEKSTFEPKYRQVVQWSTSVLDLGTIS